MSLQVGELYAEIDVDQNKFSSGLKSAENQFKNLSNRLDNIGSKMKNIGSKMTMGITMPVVGAGVASFKMAADFQDALGATDQIFKGSSATMKNWAADLETYYGISEGQALEYTNMMGSMLQNIGGLTEEQAAKQSQTLLELAGDLTAMYGGTTDSAVQALTGSLKGNNTMLDNYGMAVNDAMVKTKAFEMGIYKGKGEMDLATKQAATLALIMEQSGAAQGQAAREADGASGSWRTATTELKNMAKAFGEELLPVITPLIQGVSGLVKRFGELSPATKKVIIGVALTAAAIGPLLAGFGMVASAIASISVALPILGTAFTVLTGPVGWVVAAIAGLLVIFKRLWDTSPKFRAWAREVGDGIYTYIAGKINALIDIVNLLIRGLNRVTDWDVPEVGKISTPSGTHGTADFRKLDQSSIGKNAAGTDFWRGGLSWVGEKGPELVNLPRGAQVLTNQQSMAAIKGQTVDHSGTVYHVFQTNDRQTVAKVAQEFERGNRRIPARVATMPSLA